MLRRHLILVVAFIITLYLRGEVLAWMVAVCLVALLSREGVVIFWGGRLGHSVHQGLRFLAQVGRFAQSSPRFASGMIWLRCILRLNLDLGNRTADFGMLLMPLALYRRLQRLVKWWTARLQISHHARGLLVEVLL